MLCQKMYDLVIENVLWRDFIEVRILGITSELRESVGYHIRARTHLHGKNLFLKNYRIVRKLRIWKKIR